MELLPILFALTIVIGVPAFIIIIRHNFEKKIESIEREKETVLKNYSEKRDKIEIPKNCLKIGCYNSETIGEKTLIRGTHYIWIKDDRICFFPTKWNIDFYYEMKIKSEKHPQFFDKCLAMVSKWPQIVELFTIKTQDIISFENTGERYFENKISGGGGGGSSIGNAIIGGVIAGGAGAIVASRNKIEPITSEFIEHDERCCILTISKDSLKYRLAFNDDNAFKEFIPEKDISIIDEIKRRNVIDKQTTLQTDNIQKIRDLGTLRDEGILTQEEFEEKKKELLKKV